MGEVLSNWLEMMAIAMLVAAACAPAEMLVGPERHPLRSRLRGMLQWSIFLFGVALATWLVQLGIRRLGIGPLLNIDVSGVGEGWAPALRISLASVLAFLPAFIIDLTYYWFHRLQHALPLLWRFHAVHHSIEELNTANCSHHWTEGFLRALLLTAPTTLLIGLNLPEIAVLSVVLGVVIGTWGQFVHADSRVDFGPLRRVLVSPAFHRVHHSIDRRHFDKNFAGIFPIIDMVFGTAFFPSGNETIRTGLSEKHEPRTLGEYLISLRDK